MRNFNKEKIIYVVFTIFMILVTAYLGWLLSSGQMTYETRTDILRPFYTFGQLFGLAALPLLFLPAFYFRYWIMFILVWFLPVTLFSILTERKAVGEVMSSLTGPQFVAQVAGYILIVLTVLSVIATALISWWRRGK